MNNHETSVIMAVRGQNKMSSLSPSKASQEDFMRIAQECSVEGCLRIQHGKGYCSPHYRRLKRYGMPTGGSPVPLFVPQPICKEAGCNTRVFVGGRCHTHWQHNTGRHETALLKQRKYRSQISYEKSSTFKYEKTPKGFLMRAYRNMQSRVTGIQKKKFHLYEGKYLLPRQEFYDWSFNDPAFNELFKAWEESNYNRKLTPSINRINSDLGYEIGNMEWITFLENSRLGALSDKRKS